MPTDLSPIDEKGGHKIHRQVTETFSPWCSECKRRVWDYWLDTEEQARRYLYAHLVTTHNAPVSILEKPATSG